MKRETNRVMQAAVLALGLIVVSKVTIPAMLSAGSFLERTAREIISILIDDGSDDGEDPGEVTGPPTTAKHVRRDLSSFVCTEGSLYDDKAANQYFGQQDTAFNTTNNFGEEWGKCFDVSPPESGKEITKTITLNDTKYKKIGFSIALGYYFRATDYKTNVELRAGPNAEYLETIYKTEEAIGANSTPINDEIIKLPKGTRVVQLVFDSNCDPYDDLYLVSKGMWVET